MLNTVEYGMIRIVTKRPSMLFDTFLGTDLIDQWEFWYVDGEVVAWELEEL